MDQVGGRGVSPEILEACRRGDREAFRALYEAHKDRVYSIAFHFFHADAEAAAEVTQQVFLKLMREVTRFRGDAAFSTWLYRLVVNACVDRSRGRRHDDCRAGSSSAGDPRRTRRVARGDLRKASKWRTPFSRRSAHSRRSFAPPSSFGTSKTCPIPIWPAALNCSIGTVASRLSRGHRLLARKLAPMRPGSPGK